MKCTLTAAVVAALALAVWAAPASAGGPTGTTIDGTPVVWTSAEPTAANGGSDRAILNHLRDLIVNAAYDSTIYAGIYSINDAELLNALNYARTTKRVKFQIVHSGNDRSSFWDSWTTAGIHRWCDKSGGAACTSTHAGGFMHAKYMLFTNTSGHNWVSWFGSANMTAGTGSRTYNNAVTVYGNQNVFNGLYWAIHHSAWNKMSWPSNDYYVPGSRGWFSTGSFNGHASPEQNGDILLDRLSPFSGSGCSVLVSTMQITRHAFAQGLGFRKWGGCNVMVVVGTNDDGTPKLCADCKRELLAWGIPVYKNNVHDKLILAHSSSRPYTVITGSHNASVGSLTQNDELVVEAKGSQALWNAAYNHWYTAWWYSTRVTS